MYEGISMPLGKFLQLGFSDTGFKFAYNDSHFCMDPYKKCLSNQLFHAMAAFNLSYFYSVTFADLATIYHDLSISALGYDGNNSEDINLGYKITVCGEKLRKGEITRNQVGQWIMDNLGDPKYVNMRISQDNLINLGDYKKKFRIFEYEQNGDKLNKWSLNGDMQTYICNNGQTFYYQDYSYFYRSEVNQGKSRAIWNNNANKIIFLSGSYLNQYGDMNNVCSNLDILTNQFGYQLHLNFNEMFDRLRKGMKDKPIF